MTGRQEQAFAARIPHPRSRPILRGLQLAPTTYHNGGQEREMRCSASYGLLEYKIMFTLENHTISFTQGGINENR
jgi:hypothetical protein